MIQTALNKLLNQARRWMGAIKKERGRGNIYIKLFIYFFLKNGAHSYQQFQDMTRVEKPWQREKVHFELNP